MHYNLQSGGLAKRGKCIYLKKKEDQFSGTIRLNFTHTANVKGQSANYALIVSYIEMVGSRIVHVVLHIYM